MTKLKAHSYDPRGSWWLKSGAAGLMLVMSALCFAQANGEKTFASPGDAVQALYKAAKSDNSAGMDALFGKNAQKILNTGDPTADKNMVSNFVRRYDQMHRVVMEPDGDVTLYVGAENWPMPIPILKNGSGQWYFDTEAGIREILYRRVGTNENDAIETLQTLVDAQREYASQPRDGNTTKQYALKFVSTAGKQDGLYWKTDDSQPASPIGPLIAEAASQGYDVQQGKPTPFHGFYFRMLMKQGADAKGGARDYVVDGRLTRGFAFVAYPAEYRNSGVMTFMVNQDGVVYEKDLGPDTDKLGAAMTEYNPDSSWSPVD